MEADFKTLKELLPKRKPDGNKGDFGRVLAIAGSFNMCGAAYFCAKAAYLTGAGLVKIFTCSENRVILQERLPEALISTYESGAEDIALLKKDIEWADVIAVGPGLSKEKSAVNIVKAVLENANVPIVPDADALNIIAEDEDSQLFAKLKEFNCGKNMSARPVLTPHMGEMARLTGKSIAELKADRLKYAEEFAALNNVILVLKDSNTVVASPAGILYVNSVENNGMATGGSGDILTGIIAGLIAQGASPEDAATAGVIIHNIAGQFAALKKGVRSMLASDILDNIYEVFKEIE